MKPHTRQRYTLLASVLLMVGGLSLSCFLWGRVRKNINFRIMRDNPPRNREVTDLQPLKAEQRQYAMNRELIQALDQDDLQRSLTLIEKGADPNTPVTDDLQRYIILTEAGAEPHTPETSENDSSTALMIACGQIWRHEDGRDTGFAAANVSLVKAMLKHGGNVNARAKYGETALMSAGEHSLTDIMVLLLQYGADINAQDAFGQTALHKGVIQQLPESVETLILHKANVNIKDFEGGTPLSWEAETGYHSPEIRRLLKQAGAKE